jgi:hypothetical protein
MMTTTGPGAGGQQQSGGSPEPGGARSGGSPEPGGTSSGADRTFTQSDLNAALAEERRRTAERYGDYDQVKQRLVELENAGKSELERAAAAQADAEKRAATATAERNRLLVAQRLTSAAVKAGAADPDTVVALLGASLTVDDSGQLQGDPDTEVTKLLEAKPFLKAAPAPNGPGRVDAGAHGHGPPPATGNPMDDLLRGGAR